MPRPSLKNERRAAILDAYGRCVARFGVEGATLERTAEEAGLARALIRHNVGNKDELLEAFLDRYLGAASEESDNLFESLPDSDRIATLVEWLFDPDYFDAEDVSVTNALITAAIDRPELAARLRQWTFEFTDALQTELERSYPDANAANLEAVATGIAAIYFNVDTFAPLGETDRLRRTSEAAVNLLLSTLDD